MFTRRNVYIPCHILKLQFPGVEIFRAVIELLDFVSNEFSTGHKFNAGLY
jgi:hypothetical protein